MKERNLAPAASANSTSTALSLSFEDRRRIGDLLRLLLADYFALYIKTKNFHWHMRGAHFRDYHLLLDEQGEQVFDATDAVAERARKIGEPALRSIGDIARHQRLIDDDTADIDAIAMLQHLRDDNTALASFMRNAHQACDSAGDLATASLLENWIDEAERRIRFLSATIDSAHGN